MLFFRINAASLIKIWQDKILRFAICRNISRPALIPGNYFVISVTILGRQDKTFSIYPGWVGSGWPPNKVAKCGTSQSKSPSFCGRAPDFRVGTLIRRFRPYAYEAVGIQPNPSPWSGLRCTQAIESIRMPIFGHALPSPGLNSTLANILYIRSSIHAYCKIFHFCIF